MYIEYFIKYYLNPILKQKQINEITKTISINQPVKTKQKDTKIKDVKKELGSNVKVVPDRESNLVNTQTKKIDTKQKSR